MKSSKILYIDMDNVLVDFPAGIAQLDESTKITYEGNYDEVPGIFALMPPLPDALESYRELSQLFEPYVLSTAPWGNPSAWSDKLLWIKKYLGDVAYKRLILSHNKNLNHGDFLIDDRPNNGAKDFPGEWLHFGPKGTYKTWPEVVAYLRTKA